MKGLITNIKKSSTSLNRLSFSDETNDIYLYQGNTLELMDLLTKQYPGGLFDTIFADPPYFLSNGGITCQNGRMVKVDKGNWDKSLGADVNHEFNRQWLLRCQKLLKDNGTIWVSGTAHVIHSIGYALQQLNYKLLNDITWEKPNPPPNLSCRYFTHATETIIWAAKNEKSKHYFDYKLMKEVNGGKQMKSVWKMLPPSKEEKIFGKHPTQKPLILIDRIISASTPKAGWVFDPFSGSSTTGVSAISLGRKFVGFEAETNYIALSRKRLLSALKRAGDSND